MGHTAPRGGIASLAKAVIIVAICSGNLKPGFLFLIRRHSPTVLLDSFNLKAETVAREKVPLQAPKLKPQAKLSLGARLALAVKGCAKIGEYIEPKNNSLVKLYVGKCSTHGIYLDRVHAGTFEIRCPKCDDAFLLERNYLIWQEANV